MKTNTVLVFDLDDTLYNEIDFLKSAFSEIALKIANEINIDYVEIFCQMQSFYYDNTNVFKETIKKYNAPFSIEELLHIYRNHKPKIKLSQDKINLLNMLKSMNISLGLLTDGRSIQQRNKIEALGLDDWFSEVVISEEFGSEKPHVENYKYFEKVFGKGKYYYIGDNIKKDFITPNSINWTTICLQDNGVNIHKQGMHFIDEKYLAKYTILKLPEVLNIVS